MFMRWTETLQVLQLCPALIRFIGSIRVRGIWVNEIRVRNFRVKETRVRARARLRVKLRWHGSHSAEVNENINLGYSQDQGYS